MHIASADRAKKPAALAVSPSEHHEYLSSLGALADRLEPFFARRVKRVRRDEHDLAKHLFDFEGRNAVLFAFLAIAAVPIEAREIYRQSRSLYIVLYIQMSI